MASQGIVRKGCSKASAERLWSSWWGGRTGLVGQSRLSRAKEQHEQRRGPRHRVLHQGSWDRPGCSWERSGTLTESSLEKDGQEAKTGGRGEDLGLGDALAFDP